jgi:hypothetical protein
VNAVVLAIMADSLHWELIDDTWTPGDTTPKAYTYRAQVPGGWLVSIWAGDSDDDQRLAGGVTFVPDPTWGWDVKTGKLDLRKRKT